MTSHGVQRLNPADFSSGLNHKTRQMLSRIEYEENIVKGQRIFRLLLQQSARISSCPSSRRIAGLSPQCLGCIGGCSREEDELFAKCDIGVGRLNNGIPDASGSHSPLLRQRKIFVLCAFIQRRNGKRHECSPTPHNATGCRSCLDQR